MKILIITETLSVGGAETFVLRLANSLVKTHEVILVNLHPRYSHPAMIAKLSLAIRYLTPPASNRFLYDKLDSVLLKSRIDYNTIENALICFLAELIDTERPDIVHTHLFKTDYYVAMSRRKIGFNFRHITTNHGDYLLYDRNPPRRILNYTRKLDVSLGSINHFVNISEEQMVFTELWRKKGLHPALKVHKILNGYANDENAGMSRAELGISPGSFVFGMVARGIPEEGWDVLIQAFRKADIPDSCLLLIGEGPAVSQLKKAYKSDKRIIFAGFSANPVNYISMFDVGLLPSFYAAESLPTVIIEYLHCGKPVIATDVGEIRGMIDAANASAGMLIPLSNGQPDEARLTEALQRMASDKEQYLKYKEQSLKAFLKFSMDICIDKYLKVYKQP